MNVLSKTDLATASVYSRFPLVAARGKGVWLFDEKNRRYLDFVGGLGSAAVGHCNPKVVKAIIGQSKKLIHASNLFYFEAQAELSELLCAISGLEKVFLTNSGTEAVECAIKTARKATGKKKIIAFKNSFHGRTTGALSITGKAKYRQAFEPLLPDVEFAEFNNLGSVKIDGDTAAVFVEPVQGEGGVVPAEKEFLKGLADFCEDNHALLVFDEVQTGFGRTGSLFAFQKYGVTPDLLCLSKAMGGGIPIGAVVGSQLSALKKGEHASTFGGNPLACAASIATIRYLIEEKLAERAGALGGRFIGKLSEIAPSRGMGFMIAIEAENGVKREKIIAKAFGKKLLLSKAGENAIRIMPPLVASQEHLDYCFKVLEGVFSKES